LLQRAVSTMKVRLWLLWLVHYLIIAADCYILEDDGGVDNESIATESSEHNEGKTVVAVVGALFNYCC
jgi:hypothetical protein